jgi:hypothetical protein
MLLETVVTKVTATEFSSVSTEVVGVVVDVVVVVVVDISVKVDGILGHHR